MSGAIVRQIISTTKAPAAIGSYSQAVRVGNTLYISGLSTRERSLNLRFEKSLNLRFENEV